MPWIAAFTVPFTDPEWWYWLGWSVLPDVVLTANVIWLWRSLVRARGEARRQEEQSRGEFARQAETLRWATELAEVGTWFWDLASGAIDWSPRAKALFALPPGQNPHVDYFFSVLHPDDRERVRAAIDHSLHERQDYRTVFRVMHPDGTQRWVAALGRGQYAADGRPVSMGGVTMDVTGLRTIENELQVLKVFSKQQAAELDLARRFQLLAENATDVVMETDAAGIIRWISPSVRLQIGRDPADMVGTHLAPLVHPDERSRLRTLEDQVTQGAAAEARLRLRIVDAGYRWFALSLRPVFDDHEAVIGRVGGWRDIHREVQAQEVLAAERHRLRAALEGMLDPLVIIEPVRDDDRRVVDFTYLDVNPAACAWFETDRDHLVGARLCETFPEADSSGLLRMFGELTETGRPLVLDEFPFMVRGTSMRWLDLRGIRGDDWISLAWRDVTERHVAAAQIASSEEQFRLLAENSTDVILRLDAHDAILWISPSVTPVLGWTQAEWVGRDGKELLATAETRAQYARDKARVAAGQGATSRTQVRAAAGDIHWMEVHTFPYRTTEGIVSGMVASMHVIDEQVRMEQDLERRARIDEVTGLSSRRELLDRLAAIVARREPTVGVLWCDIDSFKAINDKHGHAAGDAVLEALGERIRGCLRSTDDLGGRIAGDELIVILRGIGGLDEAVAFGEKLLRLAAEPIPVGDQVIRATISIGVTLAEPDEEVDVILARADDAMYRAKAQGKNQVVAAGEPAVVRAAS